MPNPPTSTPVELACKGLYTPDHSSGYNRESVHACELALNNSAGNLTGRSKTSGEYNMPADLEVRGLAGHMHHLVTSIKLEFNPRDPARRQVWLEIPRLDFHWQCFYWLEQPMQVRMGDTFRISWEFDNSPENQPRLDDKQHAPRYTVWSEGTEEGMCLAYVQTSLR